MQRVGAGRLAFRRTLVSTAFGTLRSTGVFSVAGQLERRRRRLLILCYHGISQCDEHRWRPDLYISQEHFRERLECLRKTRAAVLPLEEALSRLESSTLPARSVALTFDDGFYDFYRQAAPLLSEFQFPATLYLTTHYARYRLPIANLALDYLLWKGGRPAITLPAYGVAASLANDATGRTSAVRQIGDWMASQKMNTAEKDEIAKTVAAHLGIDYERLRENRLLQIMNDAEVQAIAANGIDIQLHTHRHRMPLERDLFLNEIEDNRREIRRLCGRDPSHFCYPSGRYAPLYEQWLSECGVRSATTCRHGMARSGCGQMQLPRVLDHDRQSAARFCGVVNGFVL